MNEPLEQRVRAAASMGDAVTILVDAGWPRAAALDDARALRGKSDVVEVPPGTEPSSGDE